MLGRRQMRRRGLRALRVLCVLALAGTSALVALPASADGSRALYPTDSTCQPNSAGGSCRASLEWRTNTYGPPGSQIVRRTLLNVYAQAGEVLELGSSAVGVGSGDAVVWDPGQISDQQAATLPVVTSGVNGFACSTQRAATGTTARARSPRAHWSSPAPVRRWHGQPGRLSAVHLRGTDDRHLPGRVLRYGWGERERRWRPDRRPRDGRRDQLRDQPGQLDLGLGPHRARGCRQHERPERPGLHLRPGRVHRRQRAAGLPEPVRHDR